MGMRERAWAWAENGWHPYVASSDKAEEAVKSSLRRLMQMPIPCTAIEEIQALLKSHEQYVLESHECVCGIRCDGTVECSRCGERVDEGSVDSTNGMCSDCQDATTCSNCGREIDELTEQLCEECLSKGDGSRF